MKKDYTAFPFWDSDLDIEKRLDDLIERLTLEEKFGLLSSSIKGIERLGIPACHMGGEAAHGIQARRDQAFDYGTPVNTISFTQPIGMAATWDTHLIKKAGEITSCEGRAIFNTEGGGSLCAWAPTVDMGRSPLWGRNEECYGEDPYLTGMMAGAYIKGLKGDDPFFIRMGATLKHFYANNAEENRATASSDITEEEKNAYYFEPYRLCIEAGAEGVMAAYNKVNGIPCAANPELNEVLKGRFGFKGHVVTDGGGLFIMTKLCFDGDSAAAFAAALKAGCDAMSDDPAAVEAAAKESYARGLVAEADLDRAIRNTFRTRLRLGFCDGKNKNPYAGIGKESIDTYEGRQLARQMAAEACVLLQNKDELLPLKGVKTIALIGNHAGRFYPDWYGGVSSERITVRQGLSEWAAEAGVKILFDEADDTVRIKTPDGYLAHEGEKVLFAGEPEEWQITYWSEGRFTLRTMDGLILQHDEEKGFGLKEGEAFAWFVREIFYLKEGMLLDWRGEDICPAKSELVSSGLKRAEELCGKADAVILAAGCHPLVDAKEERDRKDILVKERDVELVLSAEKANKNIVLLYMANYPFALDMVKDHVKSIITCATGNMEHGRGIADVLSGKVSPAGRLVQTWYSSKAELKDKNDYHVILSPQTYLYNDKDILYPFGFGLSYSKTECRIENVMPSPAGADIHVSLKNEGKYKTDHVIAVFAGKKEKGPYDPIRKLVAFERVKDIMPGEERRVCLSAAVCGEFYEYDLELV
ncbi:MAG: glycoside hydrolase family 3 C-terminal domain-containing protein [Lachnospiraceae bacterium]|nr:glycoside hydrolase family 3 C-terminal domain-containing protein [Lachnospiraceae bacterium]